MMVVESRPIAEVARDIQVNEGTLGAWGSRYGQEHAGEEPALDISERARLRELERENRELRMKAGFLGKAAVFFAQEYRDGEVRVHRRRGRQLSRAVDVHLGGSIRVGLLPLEVEAIVGHREAPCVTEDRHPPGLL